MAKENLIPLNASLLTQICKWPTYDYGVTAVNPPPLPYLPEQALKRIPCSIVSSTWLSYLEGETKLMTGLVMWWSLGTLQVCFWCALWDVVHAMYALSFFLSARLLRNRSTDWVCLGRSASHIASTFTEPCSRCFSRYLSLRYGKDHFRSRIPNPVCPTIKKNNNNAARQKEKKRYLLQISASAVAVYILRLYESVNEVVRLQLTCAVNL